MSLARIRRLRLVLRLHLRLLWVAVGRSGGRSILTAGAMSVGVAAMVVLGAFDAGAERAFREALATSGGENLLAVTPVRRERDALRGDRTFARALTLADALAIRERSPAVARVAPLAMGTFVLRHGRGALVATAIGTTPDFEITQRQVLVAGRFLDAWDVSDQAPVAVLGAEVVQQLFGGEQPLGERILVGGVPLEVIGVLAAKGAGRSGTDEDSRILVPVTTAQRRLLESPRDEVARILVQAASHELLSSAQDEVRSLLRARRGLIPGQDDDVTVRSQEALLAARRDSDGIFRRVLGGLAFLTLLLGGTGLLAVTLLSVRARRGEIGLRRALGARRHHIAVQFLVEALVLAILGALAGMLVGGAISVLGVWAAGWTLAFSWQAVAWPTAASALVALLFAVVPAVRAARLDPITALRS